MVTFPARVKVKNLNPPKDDDEGLPWLDRVTEKHRESLSGRPVGARHREGFLQRKGDWTGFWRRRYFKLADHQLTYYRSDTDESAALTIPVDAMADVIEDEKMKPFCFRIEIRGRKSLFLCGYSHHDSAKWVADLRYEIEHFGSNQSNHFEIISGNASARVGYSHNITKTHQCIFYVGFY